MRWLHSLLCLCLFISQTLNAAESTDTASASETPAPETTTSAATATASAATSTEQSTQNTSEYQDLISDWQHHPDVRQLDQLWVLHHKTDQPYPQGLSIILPEWNLTAAVTPISTNLNQLGYDSVITFPFPEQRTVNPGDEKQQEQIKQIQNRLGEQLNVIGNNLQVQGHRLMVAQGSSAVWLISQLNQDNSLMPDALILLDAYFPDQAANQLMARQVAMLTIPVLDLYHEDMQRWVKQAQQERTSAFKQMNKLNWRQRSVSDAVDINQNIKGWFSSLGWN